MATGPTVYPPPETHSLLVGYVLWIFGFTGSHRFYYGKPITGTIWFFTLGLHRFYLGKILTGILYLLTGGLFLIGIVYDFWTLNGQVSARNREAMANI